MSTKPNLFTNDAIINGILQGFQAIYKSNSPVRYMKVMTSALKASNVELSESTLSRIKSAAISRNILVVGQRGYVSYVTAKPAPTAILVKSLTTSDIRKLSTITKLEPETIERFNASKKKKEEKAHTPKVIASEGVIEVPTVQPEVKDLSSYEISELVAELRNRGCEVTCVQTIKKEY